jgi:hypothetical protein
MQADPSRDMHDVVDASWSMLGETCAVEIRSSYWADKPASGLQSKEPCLWRISTASAAADGAVAQPDAPNTVGVSTKEPSVLEHDGNT